MKFVLFICLVFWWLVTAYSAIKSQIEFTKDNGGKDNLGFYEYVDLLGPSRARLLYTLIFFLAILFDNILLIIALALSKYANNPDVFHHYLITLLMLNVVFDLAASPIILKLDMHYKTFKKAKISFGLMDLITIIFGTITIFVGFN